jgi:DNA-binding NarL/FixJ family response regulator
MSFEAIFNEKILSVIAGLLGVVAAIFGFRANSKKTDAPSALTNTQSQSMVNNVVINTNSNNSQPPEASKIDKANTHILFIDDDTSFKVVKILKTAGWSNTRIKSDIKALDEADVVAAKILFVDIQGVGKALGFSDEGLGLVVALKRRYPEKKVVIYSTEQNGDRFHAAFQVADRAIPKTSDPYTFMSLIEDLLQT